MGTWTLFRSKHFDKPIEACQKEAINLRSMFVTAVFLIPLHLSAQD